MRLADYLAGLLTLAPETSPYRAKTKPPAKPVVLIMHTPMQRNYTTKVAHRRRASRGRWLFPTRLHTDIQRKMSSGRRCTMPEQSELPQQKGKRVIMKINDRKE